MLSKTAERNPRPKAVCQEAAGSFSTGIIAAQATSESRKIVPLNVAGITFQSGARSGIEARIAAHTASPITAARSSQTGNQTLATTLPTMAATRMNPTLSPRGQSAGEPAAASLLI